MEETPLKTQFRFFSCLSGTLPSRFSHFERGLNKHPRNSLFGVMFPAALLLLATGQNAVAKTLNFKETDSGSAVQVLFSYDGLDWSFRGIGGGRLQPGGDFTLDEIVQSAADGKNCTVPGGTANAGIEDTLVGQNEVLRFQPSGDLLYLHATALTSCSDFSSLVPPFPFVANASFVITGGTGKYTGATGTLTKSVKGTILSVPGGLSGAGPGFGATFAAEAAGAGTLTIP